MNKDGEEFERWYEARIKENYGDYLDCLPQTKKAYQAGLAAGRAEAKPLVEALEFYADKNNWDNEDNSNFKIQIVDDYQEFRPNRKAEYFGGKRARETLARIARVE